MKRFCALVLTLLMLFAAVLPASAEEEKIYDFEEKITIDLACDIGAAYSIGHDVGTPYALFLEGNGKLIDFDYENPDDNTNAYLGAMDSFFNQKNVIIGEGITYIGDGFFKYYTNTKCIYIPDSVTEISETAFAEDNEITVFASADSYAIEYAIAHGMNYKVTDLQSSLIGDVNSDLAVNGKDVLQLRKYIIGLVDSINEQNADVNYDGNINGKDVLQLRKALIGLVELVPAETPSDIVETSADV